VIDPFTSDISSRFKILLSILILAVLVISCHKEPIREQVVENDPGNPPVIPPSSATDGIFVVNEGNFNRGNATITLIMPADTLIEQDIFKAANNRSLGDVAQTMKIYKERGYIVVNNSNTIEVVSLADFKSIKTISGFNSPRNIQFIDSTKAYVTNLLKNISVVDLKSLTITKSINIPSWTEGIIKYKNYVYVSSVGNYEDPNSKRKPQLLIIDTKEDRIIDSIQSGKEPLGIVIDKKEKIWVLCTGGFDSYEAPTLIRINPDLRAVEKVFHFPNVKDAPSRLCINSLGDTLYFLKDGIYQMPVSSADIPSAPAIPSNGHMFYGLGIDPSSGNIFVTDALDYLQNGWVYRYNQVTGALLNSYQAGRIPGSFCFPKETSKK
jgi:hypothetical protein